MTNRSHVLIGQPALVHHAAMPRPAKPLPVDLSADDHELELLELAEQRHALNVLVTEFDWLRAQELALRRGGLTVSDLVRGFLAEGLASVPEAEHLRDIATTRLENELRLRNRRAQIDGIDVARGPGDRGQSIGRRKNQASRSA